MRDYALEGEGLATCVRTHYETRVSVPGDPGAIARAMNQVLEQFSDDVASRMRSALEKQTETE